MMFRNCTTAISLALLVACGGDGKDQKGTETGNGLVSSVAMALESSEGGAILTGRDAQNTVLAVSAATAYIDRITFALPGGLDCSGFDNGGNANLSCEGTSVRLSGPIVVDLIARTSTPSLSNIRLPAGTYRDATVMFKKGRTDEGLIAAGDPLEDRVLAASGRFDYQGADTGFDVRLNQSVNLRFESSDGIEVTETGTVGIDLLLDVAGWFSGLPLTDCLDRGDVMLTNGRLDVANGNGQCRQVENTLAKNVRESGRLARRR